MTSYSKRLGRFLRNKLPDPNTYFTSQGLKLIGRGDWKSTVCPFHEDKKPSLRVNLSSGGFRCMVCGTHGGDVLQFHRLRHQLGFVDAAKELHAWEQS